MNILTHRISDQRSQPCRNIELKKSSGAVKVTFALY